MYIGRSNSTKGDSEMSDLTEFLTRVGLTWGQAIGFTVTILTALWAARATRASSSES
jgi:hypothetical protein